MVAFAIQFGASLAAVLLLVALAAWAKIARPTPPLTEAAARALFAVEFPGQPLRGLWLAADGAGAIARSGSRALTLFRVGDGYVGRSLAWDAAVSLQGGDLDLAFDDLGAPRARLRMGDRAWPPREVAA